MMARLSIVGFVGCTAALFTAVGVGGIYALALTYYFGLVVWPHAYGISIVVSALLVAGSVGFFGIRAIYHSVRSWP